MSKNISLNYNDEGQVRIITEQLRYEHLECFEYPKSCTSCPVGYMQHNCGRNYPFKTEDYSSRPTTCKLRLVK